MPDGVKVKAGKMLEEKVLGSPLMREKLEPGRRTEENLATMERNVMTLADEYCKGGQDEEMIELVCKVRPFLKHISKSKATRLVGQLVDKFLSIENMDVDDEAVELIRGCIKWADEEKRTFMRQALQARLVSLLYRCRKYPECLGMSHDLVQELKKVDDKALLVEVQLWESKSALALGNVDKARNALTMAKGFANAIYVLPELQAELDLHAGILNVYGRSNFKTAHGYFFEAFEELDSHRSPRAATALKYMMLTKLIQEQYDDVLYLTRGETALKYLGAEVDAMRDLAMASKKKSLSDFKKTLKKHKQQLEGDEIVGRNIHDLYERMLEQNLCCIVQPYSTVQIAHVAKKIQLPVQDVEKKLCQMILDKKVKGILDYKNDQLVFVSYEDHEATDIENASADTFKAMAHVMDHLHRKGVEILRD